jgi:DNA-binding transcriptional MocR family regulator
VASTSTPSHPSRKTSCTSAGSARWWRPACGSATCRHRPDWWDGHLALLRGIYAERADALTDAAEAALAGRLRVRRPEGGMFVWAEILDPAVTSGALIATARDLGLALVPGSEFSVTNTFDHALRFSYSTLTPAELVEAIDILAAAFDALGSVRA